MKTNLLAERMGYGENVAVPLDQVVERVTAGDVIVLRDCPQVLGYLETFHAGQMQTLLHRSAQHSTAPSTAEPSSLPALTILPLTEIDGVIRVTGLVQTLPVEATILGHNAAQSVDVG